MIAAVGRDELPACLEILRASYEESARRFGMTEENCPYRGRTRLPLRELEREYDESALMYCCFQGGARAGFLSLSPRGRALHIRDIAILPEWQGRGLGGELMRFAREVAKHLHCEKISLDMIDDNSELKRWYEGHGFETVRLRRFEKVGYAVGTMESEA